MRPKDRRYTREHEWVLQEGEEIVVGITDYAAEELGDIVTETTRARIERGPAGLDGAISLFYAMAATLASRDARSAACANPVSLKSLVVAAPMRDPDTACTVTSAFVSATFW